MDEEPYNLATLLGVQAARSVGAEPIFFTWQNLLRRYPPPFNWFERIVYRACAVAIAGNAEAREVLVRKGYRGEIVVLPQFGVDPTIFQPQTEPEEEERTQRDGKEEALSPPLTPPSSLLAVPHRLRRGAVARKGAGPAAVGVRRA